MRKCSRRLKSNPRSAVAERHVCRMIEFERRSQIKPRARNDRLLAIDMRLRECRSEVYAGSIRACGTNGRDGDSFVIGGRSDYQLVADGQIADVAHLDIRC